MIVVKILTSFINYAQVVVGERASSRGIGFVFRRLDQRSVIITCAHTVRGARSAFVRCGRQHLVQILHICEVNDVAVLSCPTAFEKPDIFVRMLSYKSKRRSISILTPYKRVRVYKKNGKYGSAHAHIGLSGSPLIDNGTLIGVMCGCNGDVLVVYQTLSELVKYSDTL